MKSGAINIDRYADRGSGEQFDFLYENFSILQELLRDYREDLIAEVIEQKIYNRRSQSGDLGVRIQVSMGNSNPTLNQAIEHMTIVQAIDEGMLDEDFFEDTDDRQELIRKVSSYHRVNTDLEVFTSKLGTMNLKDQNILKPYLLREKSMDDLAVDLGIDYRSAVKHVYRITPVSVRKESESYYEMISGHRRMHAAKRLGLETIPAIVKEMTDDESTIAMVRRRMNLS